MDKDPIRANAELYRVLFENERVRVLEYHDRPGDQTVPHSHPDSVMVTLSSFRRLLVGDTGKVEVEIPAGVARWLAAQEHSGRNIGETETRVIFVELKEPRQFPDQSESLGPS